MISRSSPAEAEHLTSRCGGTVALDGDLWRRVLVDLAATTFCDCAGLTGRRDALTHHVAYQVTNPVDGTTAASAAT